MELVIVPVTLLVGMALIYWGIQGTPGQTQQMAFASTIGQRPAPKQRRPYTPPPATEEPNFLDFDRSPSSLRQSDVLLSDLMTEMIEMRADIAKIKTRMSTIAPDKVEPKVAEPVAEEVKAEPLAQRPVRRRTTISAA